MRTLWLGTGLVIARVYTAQMQLCPGSGDVSTMAVKEARYSKVQLEAVALGR